MSHEHLLGRLQNCFPRSPTLAGTAEQNGYTITGTKEVRGIRKCVKSQILATRCRLCVTSQVFSSQVLRYDAVQGDWREAEPLLFPRLAYVASVQVFFTQLFMHHWLSVMTT